MVKCPCCPKMLDRKEVSKLYNFIDNDGNTFTLAGDWKLYVNLKNAKNKFRRNIGWFEWTQDFYIYHKMIKTDNLFKTSNSIGVSWPIVSKMADVDRVICHTGYRGYSASAYIIKRDGQFLYYKNQGFEKQIFMDINDWADVKKRSTR